MATIQRALDGVVDLMVADLEISDWGHWLVYLLEKLDHRTTAEDDDDAFEMALLQLRSDIDTRLVAERW